MPADDLPEGMYEELYLLFKSQIKDKQYAPARTFRAKYMDVFDKYDKSYSTGMMTKLEEEMTDKASDEGLMKKPKRVFDAAKEKTEEQKLEEKRKRDIAKMERKAQKEKEKAQKDTFEQKVQAEWERISQSEEHKEYIAKKKKEEAPLREEFERWAKKEGYDKSPLITIDDLFDLYKDTLKPDYRIQLTPEQRKMQRKKGQELHKKLNKLKKKVQLKPKNNDWNDMVLELKQWDDWVQEDVHGRKDRKKGDKVFLLISFQEDGDLDYQLSPTQEGTDRKTYWDTEELMLEELFNVKSDKPAKKKPKTPVKVVGAPSTGTKSMPSKTKPKEVDRFIVVDEKGKVLSEASKEEAQEHWQMLKDSGIVVGFHQLKASAPKKVEGKNIDKLTKHIEMVTHVTPKKEKEAIPGGLAAGMPDKDFDKDMLYIGKIIETEHSPDIKNQKEIAKDHLVEDALYYLKDPFLGELMEHYHKSKKGSAVKKRLDKIFKRFNIDVTKVPKEPKVPEEPKVPKVTKPVGRMKIQQHHYDAVKEKMAKYFQDEQINIQGLENIFKRDKKTDERFRWDMYHASGASEGSLMKEMYEYLNDDNIDVALKRIIKELKKEQLEPPKPVKEKVEKEPVEDEPAPEIKKMKFYELHNLVKTLDKDSDLYKQAIAQIGVLKHRAWLKSTYDTNRELKIDIRAFFRQMSDDIPDFDDKQYWVKFRKDHGIGDYHEWTPDIFDNVQKLYAEKFFPALENWRATGTEEQLDEIPDELLESRDDYIKDAYDKMIKKGWTREHLVPYLQELGWTEDAAHLIVDEVTDKWMEEHDVGIEEVAPEEGKRLSELEVKLRKWGIVKPKLVKQIRGLIVDMKDKKKTDEVHNAVYDVLLLFDEYDAQSWLLQEYGLKRDLERLVALHFPDINITQKSTIREIRRNIVEEMQETIAELRRGEHVKDIEIEDQEEEDIPDEHRQQIKEEAEKSEREVQFESFREWAATVTDPQELFRVWADEDNPIWLRQLTLLEIERRRAGGEPFEFPSGTKAKQKKDYEYMIEQAQAQWLKKLQPEEEVLTKLKEAETKAHAKDIGLVGYLNMINNIIAEERDDILEDSEHVVRTISRLTPSKGYRVRLNELLQNLRDPAKNPNKVIAGIKDAFYDLIEDKVERGIKFKKYQINAINEVRELFKDIAQDLRNIEEANLRKSQQFMLYREIPIEKDYIRGQAEVPNNIMSSMRMDIKLPVKAIPEGQKAPRTHKSVGVTLKDIYDYWIKYQEEHGGKEPTMDELIKKEQDVNDLISKLKSDILKIHVRLGDKYDDTKGIWSRPREVLRKQKELTEKERAGIRTDEQKLSKLQQELEKAMYDALHSKGVVVFMNEAKKNGYYPFFIEDAMMVKEINDQTGLQIHDYPLSALQRYPGSKAKQALQKSWLKAALTRQEIDEWNKPMLAAFIGDDYDWCTWKRKKPKSQTELKGLSQDLLRQCAYKKAQIMQSQAIEATPIVAIKQMLDDAKGIRRNQTRVDELTKEMDTLREQIKETTEDVLEKQETFKGMRKSKKKTALKKEIAGLKKETKTLESQIEDVEKELKDTKLAIRPDAEIVAQLTAKKDDLLKQMKEKDDLIKEKEEQATQAEKKAEDVMEEREKLTEQVGALEKMVAIGLGEQRELKGEQEELKDEIKDLTTQIKELEAQASAYEKAEKAETRRGRTSAAKRARDRKDKAQSKAETKKSELKSVLKKAPKTMREQIEQVLEESVAIQQIADSIEEVQAQLAALKIGSRDTCFNINEIDTLKTSIHTKKAENARRRVEAGAQRDQKLMSEKEYKKTIEILDEEEESINNLLDVFRSKNMEDFLCDALEMKEIRNMSKKDIKEEMEEREELIDDLEF